MLDFGEKVVGEIVLLRKASFFRSSEDAVARFAARAHSGASCAQS
jgi:hypothetical protein